MRSVQMLEPRDATDEELLAVPHPALRGLRARALADRQRAFSTAAIRRPSAACTKRPPCVVGASLERHRRDHARATRRRAFVPIAGLHHAGARSRRRILRVQRLRRGIEQLRARHGLTRIAYVDIDAHHGDGVFYGFEDDPAVIFADLHEDGATCIRAPARPTRPAAAPAAGTKLNVPLPAGRRRCARSRRCGRRCWRTWSASTPEFLILQCGADSIDGDPITHLRFSRDCMAARRAICARWPTGWATGGCWRSAAAATTAAISRRPGPRWSKTCSERLPLPAARGSIRYNSRPVSAIPTAKGAAHVSETDDHRRV